MRQTHSEIEPTFLSKWAPSFAFAKARGIPYQRVKAHGALGTLCFIDLKHPKSSLKAPAPLSTRKSSLSRWPGRS